MQHITYTPRGVCSRKIDIDIEDGIVTFSNTSATVANAENGQMAPFAFEDLQIRLPGTYRFHVTETKGTAPAVVYDDRTVTVTDPTPPYCRRPMRLVREGDRVTLYRGGIVLLSLTGAPAAASVPAPVRITWKEYHAMIHYFYGLTVATRA